MNTKHIILIGFKSVGKTCIGKALAHDLGLAYTDCDTELERTYNNKRHTKLSCREIMKLHGEQFFRDLEQDVLRDVLLAPTRTIISLGGGAVVRKEGHPLLQAHTIIHVTAPKALVYERIMVNGRPAFFKPEESPYEAFQRLWNERKPIYESLATVTVDNNASIAEAVKKIKTYLVTIV